MQKPTPVTAMASIVPCDTPVNTRKPAPSPYVQHSTTVAGYRSIMRPMTSAPTVPPSWYITAMRDARASATPPEWISVGSQFVIR